MSFMIYTLALHLPTHFRFFLFSHPGNNFLCFEMSFDPLIFFHSVLFLYCFDYFLVIYIRLYGQNGPDVTDDVWNICTWGSSLQESLPVPPPQVSFKNRREKRDPQERREKTRKEYFHLFLPPYSNVYQEEAVKVRVGNGTEHQTAASLVHHTNKLLCDAESVVHAPTDTHGPGGWSNHHPHRSFCSWPHLIQNYPCLRA